MPVQTTGIGAGLPIATSGAQPAQVTTPAPATLTPTQGQQKIKVVQPQPTIGGVKPPQFSDVLPQVQTRPDGSQFIQLPVSITIIIPPKAA